MASSAVSGALGGAAKGFAVGGPIGAVIGGLAGLFGGRSADKAKRYRRLASAEEQKGVDLQQARQRRDLVRAMFLARGEALAAGASQETGGLESSGVQGVLSSVSTQGVANSRLFENLVTLQKNQQYYLKKAGKAQDTANTISGLLDEVASSGVSFKFGKKKPAPSGGLGGPAPKGGPFQVDMGYPGQ